MSDKVQHLEFIQGVINRMASNSFQVKGWSVLLVSALVAIASKDSNPKLVLISFLPTFAFWLLDGYFLWQERLFRKLYDRARLSEGDAADFSMATDTKAVGAPSWVRATFSTTLLLFHGVVFASVVVAWWLPSLF